MLYRQACYDKSTMSKAKKAFTVVELAVVIAVIAILATITAVGYTRLQKDTRDTERETDIAVIQSALEVFYEKNGVYPYHVQINNETFLRNTLSLSETAYRAPGQTTRSLTYSMSNSPTSPTVNQYFYHPQTASNAVCTSTSDPCVKYTLRWRKETANPSTNPEQTTSKYGW